jgi:hypothetical protein
MLPKQVFFFAAWLLTARRSLKAGVGRFKGD